MNVHVIKSAGVDESLYNDTLSLLQSVNGPICFVCRPESHVELDDSRLFTETIPSKRKFEKAKMFNLITTKEVTPEAREFPLSRRAADWSLLFRECDSYREENNIPADEHVILLTDTANQLNWFSSTDPNNPRNGFIHTEDWDHYIRCTPAFPVAYEVSALILQGPIFGNMTNIKEIAHVEPIGCMNDLCLDKKDTLLRMRTADICSECIDLIPDIVPIPVVHHILAIMGSLREKMMYAQNFRQHTPLGKMHIDGQGKIKLPDFANIHINLFPLERALYRLFLNHPEGIYQSNLADYRNELYELYGRYARIDDLNRQRQKIDNLVDIRTNNANASISKIKHAFEKALGNGLAKAYYIASENGGRKKIKLDRNLVSYE